MSGRLRRAGGVGLERISDHPLKAAGAIAVLLGMGVIMGGALGTTGTAVRNAQDAQIALSALVAFAIAHPAYPIAVVAGIGVLFWRS